MTKGKSRKAYRQRRHRRVRRKVHGTADCPRMAVNLSNRRMQAQFVDDDRSLTLGAVSSDADRNVTVDLARELGGRAAELASGKGIRKVVFDRGGFRYHGRVKAFVEGAQAGGLTL
ncbi:MAG: 50S ribosomal protein L18 [Lentisphaerae bacterium]|nr:50S ribosomal protein L18 [Lentisphaerota bacterium]